MPEPEQCCRHINGSPVGPKFELRQVRLVHGDDHLGSFREGQRRNGVVSLPGIVAGYGEFLTLECRRLPLRHAITEASGPRTNHNRFHSQRKFDLSPFSSCQRKVETSPFSSLAELLRARIISLPRCCIPRPDATRTPRTAT